MRAWRFAPWLAMSMLFAVGAPAAAQGTERPKVATLKIVEGDVEICSAAGSCRPARRGDELFLDDTVLTGTGPGDRAVMIRDAEPHPALDPVRNTIVAMDRDTEFTMRGLFEDRPGGRSLWSIRAGQIWAWIVGEPDIAYPVPRRTTSNVPRRTTSTDIYNANAAWACGIRGTTLIASNEPDTGTGSMEVLEGEVACEDRDGNERTVGAMERLRVPAEGEATLEDMSLGEWIAKERELIGGLDVPDELTGGPVTGSWSGTWTRNDTRETGGFTLAIGRDAEGRPTATFLGQAGRLGLGSARFGDARPRARVGVRRRASAVRLRRRRAGRRQLLDVWQRRRLRSDRELHVRRRLARASASA